MGRRIYVASSWRNEQQPAVISALRAAGHEVYDFRNPAGRTGFGWRQATDEPPPWSAERTREVLALPISQAGFDSDFDAMKWADTFVMLQPCGRSAALELGWAESVRVDLRVTWKGGGPEAWMHAFDAELKGHPLGGAPSLHVTAESEVLSPQWGQVEHLARFAAYAALATTAASDVAMRRIGGLVAWGVDESVFAATGGE